MHCDDNILLKKKLLARLKKAEGQVRGLQKMLEEDKYCIDIITQSNAVRSALVSFETELLENHLKTCVVELIKSGKVDKAARELSAVYKRSCKNK